MEEVKHTIDPSKTSLLVAKGTTIGDAVCPLYCILTEMHIYLGKDRTAVAELMIKEQDTTEIKAAGPASPDIRRYAAHLFDQIGFFDDEDAVRADHNIYK